MGWDDQLWRHAWARSWASPGSSIATVASTSIIWLTIMSLTWHHVVEHAPPAVSHAPPAVSHAPHLSHVCTPSEGSLVASGQHVAHSPALSQIPIGPCFPEATHHSCLRVEVDAVCHIFILLHDHLQERQGHCHLSQACSPASLGLDRGRVLIPPIPPHATSHLYGGDMLCIPVLLPLGVVETEIKNITHPPLPCE